MSLNAKAIGLKILEARLSLGITQAELAQRLGISRTAVGRWETGHSVPRQAGIPRVAKILGKDPAWLLEGSSQINTVSENLQVLRAERHTLKEIRQEVSKLGKRINTPAQATAPAVAPAREEKVLEHVMRHWDSAKPEAQLIAALLITGDWSYRLKLWNLNLAVDEDAIAKLGVIPARAR